MAQSITGIVDLFVALSLAVLSLRLFHGWQESRTLLVKFLFSLSVTYVIFFASVAVGGIFYAQYGQALLIIDIIGAFTQAIGGVLGGYFMAYLLLPKILPWFGALPMVALGLLATWLTATLPTQPFVEGAFNAINWNYQWNEAIPRLLVLLITFLPLLFLFVKSLLQVATPQEKLKALGIGAIFFMGSVSALFDFVIERQFGLPAISGDFVLAAVAVLTFGVTVGYRKEGK